MKIQEFFRKVRWIIFGSTDEFLILTNEIERLNHRIDTLENSVLQKNDLLRSYLMHYTDSEIDRQRVELINIMNIKKEPTHKLIKIKKIKKNDTN